MGNFKSIENSGKLGSLTCKTDENKKIIKNGLSFCIPNGKDRIYTSLNVSGTWEPELQKIFKKYIKQIPKYSTILDIGSHIGLHTKFLAFYHPHGLIYSFEPVPKTYGIMKRNTGMYKNVIQYNMALGDKNENSFIFYDTTGNTGRSSINFPPSKYKKIPIKIIKLDSLNLHNVKLIKIDTEGFEMDVLKGGFLTIKKYKPIIFIEIWKKQYKKISSEINNIFPFYIIKKIKNDDYILLPKELKETNI